MLDVFMLQTRRRTCLAIAIWISLSASSLVFSPDDMKWPGIFVSGLLVWISFIDLERKIIPNMLSYSLLVLGLAWAGGFRVEAFLHHVAGAVVGYGCIWCVYAVYMRRTGRIGIGLGDAKLLAAGGAWLGWMALPYILLMSSLSGLIYACILTVSNPKMGFKMAIPFGPFIAAGIWGVWLLSPHFVRFIY